MTELQPEDVAAVVVLYRPEADTVFNLSEYASDFGHVWAIDNSEEPDARVVAAISAIPTVECVPMHRNSGLGTALNAGVARARDAGFAWVVTLDQDSSPAARMLFELSRCACSCLETRELGLVSPVLKLENGPEETGYDGCREVLTTITSGSLVSVAAWEKVAGFDEGLFIDQVDHDFCLRLHSAGLAVLECGSAVLAHRMGEMRQRRLLGPVYVSNHSALRRYYITRNRFAVSQRFRAEFPGFRAREMSAQRNELMKVVLLEDHKVAKLLMSWRGYRDYRRGITGPYAAPQRRRAGV
jgi:rhamnosyltransferase